MTTLTQNTIQSWTDPKGPVALVLKEHWVRILWRHEIVM